jgi:hypothetical protein
MYFGLKNLETLEISAEAHQISGLGNYGNPCRSSELLLKPWKLYTIEEKGVKPDRKPYHLSYSIRSPYRNLKSENSQEYAQKPQRNCTFINSASGRFECGGWHC